MRLLFLGITFLVIGFVLCVLASNIAYAAPPSITDLLRDGVNALLTSVTKALNGPTMSDHVQGLGSAFGYLGFILIVLWVLQQLIPKRRSL